MIILHKSLKRNATRDGYTFEYCCSLNLLATKIKTRKKKDVCVGSWRTIHCPNWNVSGVACSLTNHPLALIDGAYILLKNLLFV